MYLRHFSFFFPFSFYSSFLSLFLPFLCALCLFPPSFPPSFRFEYCHPKCCCYLSLISVISSDLGMSFLVMVFLSILGFPENNLEVSFFRRYFFSLPVHFKILQRGIDFLTDYWNSSRL